MRTWFRRWLVRRVQAWERRHPEEARELTIKVLEGYLGSPLNEDARRLIREMPKDPEL
jgi:ABC-type nitrate/sulfonate/bicarbonate transport system substrate-binding protein